jgi:hypothetical protein
MDERRIPILNDEPKHKKKSTAKGLPRSKHKHIYETVLLESDYHLTDFKTGADKIIKNFTPTKVCTICGRIDKIDKDPSYYCNSAKGAILPWFTGTKELNEKALRLPKWYAGDYFSKTAIKREAD